MLTSIPPRPRPSWWTAVTTWRSPTGVLSVTSAATSSQASVQP